MNVQPRRKTETPFRRRISFCNINKVPLKRRIISARNPRYLRTANNFASRGFRSRRAREIPQFSRENDREQLIRKPSEPGKKNPVEKEGWGWARVADSPRPSVYKSNWQTARSTFIRRTFPAFSISRLRSNVKHVKVLLIKLEFRNVMNLRFAKFYRSLLIKPV